MVDEKLADQARDLGEYAMNAFREIGKKCPGTIDDVRGHGLMIGIVLTENGKEIWEALVERGFILNLTQERVLRLVPPLVISKDDIDVFASALEELLSQKMK
jgi:acetylornithine aminotransferase